MSSEFNTFYLPFATHLNAFVQHNCAQMQVQRSRPIECVIENGGAENDGHEIAGHENDGPNSRA